ncbi:MAG: energy-coupling factor transporter ATPase [Clostridiales bacterium]|nr:energy-coupling factor transporter ATPase [Clostridiales bacterium]
MASGISVKHICFAYKNDDTGEAFPKALDDISLDVDIGSYCAVLGPNGSGKSTLAKLIDVLELPDEGEICVLGITASDEESYYDIRQRCAYVFQNPDNQIVGTIVEEDVAFGPENLGIQLPELRERVDEALRYVGLYDLRKREAASLSGGQKQKLAIAGALAMRPKVLILDESTAMLDPVSRDEFLDLVEKMNREKGITVLTITHDMNEAARCERIFVIEKGKVTMTGTPPEIFSHPDKLNMAGLELPQDISLVNEISKLADKTLTEEDIRDEEARLNTAVRYARLATSRPEEPQVVIPEARRKLLEVSDLSYSYDNGRTYALEHINLSVYEGEILAIVGKSGCGKTTLISHLNGIVRPQQGQVVLYGKDGEVLSTSRKKDLARIRQSVGLVFQYPEYQLFEETVEKDIAYGLIKLQTPEENRPARVKAAAIIAGLTEDVLTKSPFELSGGQKRRAALAGVLVMKPSVLVLDEPAAGLDPIGRIEMFMTILALRDAGTTVIIVSHNMDEAARYADRIFCIKDGREVGTGTASELFKDEETAGALGLSMPILYDFSAKIKTRLKKEYPGIKLMPPYPVPSQEAASIVRSVLDAE